MLMEKDVALDPGVGAIEIPTIIRSAFDDVIDEMNDRLRPLVAGEIDDVGIADGAAIVISAKNAVPTGFDAAGAVIRFELSGPGRKMTMAHDVRRAIERDILM